MDAHMVSVDTTSLVVTTDVPGSLYTVGKFSFYDFLFRPMIEQERGLKCYMCDEDGTYKVLEAFNTGGQFIRWYACEGCLSDAIEEEIDMNAR
jgi:hypothetical protein